jgi:hypothetical protein
MFLARLLAATLLVAGSCPLFAGEPAQCPLCHSTRAEAPVLYTVTYPVKDIAVPAPPGVPQPTVIPPVQKIKSAVEMRAAKKAEKLMRKYHEACAAGDPERARKYAREALDLDPECFDNPQATSTHSNPPAKPDFLLGVGVNTETVLAPKPSAVQPATYTVCARSHDAERSRAPSVGDFWSKQTKQDITRDLLAPYMPLPLTPVPQSSITLPPPGR